MSRGMGTNRSGFTLAEVMVTILIVGSILILSVQGLNKSLAQAAHTRNIKIARELAMLSLARLEAGLYIDELEDHMEGDYSDDDHPDFQWEIVLDTEEFYDEEQLESDRFDSWEPTDEEEDAESGDPWVVARVKVRFPEQTGRKDNIVLERWLTREFVYGPEDDEEN
jgi:prepilin-type N-terminal cleavage/methylation domain-containing protein